MVKRFFLPVFLTVLLCVPGCRSSRVLPNAEALTSPPPELLLPPPGAPLPVSEFDEIWAYLLAGSEDTLLAEYPLSDIGYFGAELDSFGRLVNVPDRAKIAFFTGRTHLVVTSGGRALTHFALAEGRPERQRLVKDLLEAAMAFDGLQIDFENVAPEDKDSFLSFLSELRDGLGDKMLTLALPARTRFIENDAYDYTAIRNLADRILVMAYDEHWSGSRPGPIASMTWCRDAAAYALAAIGGGKLIMGLPFYGRTWGNINPNRAFFNSGIERIKREEGVSGVDREHGVPFFSYEAPLTITAYYEDEYSLSVRLAMYRRMGVKAAGFWCLGQETPAIWERLRLTSE